MNTGQGDLRHMKEIYSVFRSELSNTKLFQVLFCGRDFSPVSSSWIT